MKILMRFFIGVSFVAISACGGSSGGGGDDAVVAAPVPAKPCGTGMLDIDPNTIVDVDGRLEAGDCLVNELDTDSTSKSFADEYRVTLPVNGILTVNMRSADIDAFLSLLNRSTSCSSGCTGPETAVIIVNDDSIVLGAPDAQIVFDLMAGTYIIVALVGKFPDPAEEGDYTLETIFVPN